MIKSITLLLLASTASFADCNFSIKSKSTRVVSVSDTAYYSAYSYFDGEYFRAIDYATCKEKSATKLPAAVLSIINSNQYAYVSSTLNSISTGSERSWIVGTITAKSNVCSTYVFIGEKNILATRGQYATSQPNKYVAINASCAGDTTMYTYSLNLGGQGIAARGSQNHRAITTASTPDGFAISAMEPGNITIHTINGTRVFSNAIQPAKPIIMKEQGGAQYIIKLATSNGVIETATVVVP